MRAVVTGGAGFLGSHLSERLLADGWQVVCVDNLRWTTGELPEHKAVLLDERWGFEEADNASPTPVNPDYGKPFLRTPPTSARLGVRISF